MTRFPLRRSLRCCSLTVLALGAWQSMEPTAAAAGDPYAPPAWCAQVQGGPAATQSPLFALSALHATTRQFGVGSSFNATDRALAKAMARPFAGDPAILHDYVAAIGDGEECVAHASDAALGPASVELVGNVAVVHPGTGTLTLPAGAQAVAIDVRGLPTVTADFLDPNLAFLSQDPTQGGPPHDPVRDALDAAVALALAAPVPRPLENSRQFFFSLPNTDVEEGAGDIQDYTTPTQLEPFPAGSAADLPLAILTGKALSPAAAEMAVTLRLAGRAWLFGEDVQTRVAESAWSPLAGDGLMVRWLDLSDPVSGNRFPDVVPADALGGAPVVLAAGLAGLGAPPALAPGAATRPPIVAHVGLTDQQPNTLGPGEARAGIVTFHGACTNWEVFFGQVGTTHAGIDAALEAARGTIDQAVQGGGTIDRTFYFDQVIRRFGVALHDGHNFNFDEGRPFTGYLRMKIEEINGEPVVRRSGIDGINPGDAIVGIDGTPASAWYAYQLGITSAATDRYRFNLVTRKVFLRTYGPRTLDLRAPDGQVRTVVAQPVPYDNDAAELAFGTAPVHRPSGFLTDLGAPDVYFLNMAYEVSPDELAALASIVEAQGARAMIVDMRGYPMGDHYHVAAALMPGGFYGPNFGFRIQTAPGQSYSYEPPPFSLPIPTSLIDILYPGTPTYTGPVILLVGTDTVSAGENFSMMLSNNGRPMHIVGRETGGTNGTNNGIELTGHYSAGWTAEDVHNADGSPFIGIGIPVDTPVTLTQANLANGNDPELNVAVELLGP